MQRKAAYAGMLSIICAALWGAGAMADEGPRFFPLHGTRKPAGVVAAAKPSLPPRDGKFFPIAHGGAAPRAPEKQVAAAEPQPVAMPVPVAKPASAKAQKNLPNALQAQHILDIFAPN